MGAAQSLNRKNQGSIFSDYSEVRIERENIGFLEIFVVFICCNLILHQCPAVFLRNVHDLRSGCRGPAFKCVCSWALVTIFALIPALLILTGYCCYIFCQFSTPPFPLPLWVSISTQVPSKWQCWLVAVCRAGSHSQGWYGTSLLCLELLLGPHHPLMAPVPKLVYGWLV